MRQALEQRAAVMREKYADQRPDAIATGYIPAVPIVAAQLLGLFSQKFNTLPEEILSGSQHPNVVEARGHVIRGLRKKGFSSTQIGKFLGGLHHSTVLY